MTLELYSTILTVAVIGLFVSLLFVAILLCKKGLVQKFFPRIKYETVLAWTGVLAAIATLAVLYYQFVLGLEVCKLCWWQRIFMFPIEIIVFVALLKRVRGMELAIGILATIGTGFAGYHYWNHFQNLVLGKQVVLPCGEIGLVPSCSEFAFTIFGFMTIPGMALLAFLSIMILSWWAYVLNDKS